MTSPQSLIALSLALGLLAACGGPAEEGDPTPSAPARTSYLLKADLADAGNVFSAKKKTAGDEVTVVGRVRSELDGSGAFMLVDEVFEYCGQGQEKCGCTTPWDYCCIEQEKVAEASLPVEVHDADGEVVEVGKEDLRLLDLVVLRGTLATTESGELFLVVKDGWFRRERPTLPAGVDWPE